MASVIGTERAVSPEAMGDAMKGLVWTMQIEDKWYEVEFTGHLTDSEYLIVKIKKPTKAPGGHT